MDTETISPTPIGVKEVRVEDLDPNPHNPRLLFDREPLDVLKASVGKVGILVPLTVYRDSATDRYVILDGQRRWLVAKELGLDLVPVNQVAEPTLVQNIVTMFQIHKLREDWELMPTALKLEVLMKELEENAAGKLASLTGLDKAVVQRCKKLLSYPRRYQDMMLMSEPTSRVKADFFIELYPIRVDRLLNSFDWFDRNDITDHMLYRYENRKGIKAVTDFRIIKQHITNARRAGKELVLEKKFGEFVNDYSLAISHLGIQSAAIDAAARRITSNISSLIDSIRSIDVAEFYGEEEMWAAMEELVEVLRIRLERANRRVDR